jgi:hypothetical protein
MNWPRSFAAGSRAESNEWQKPDIDRRGAWDMRRCRRGKKDTGQTGPQAGDTDRQQSYPGQIPFWSISVAASRCHCPGIINIGSHMLAW